MQLKESLNSDSTGTKAMKPGCPGKVKEIDLGTP
jgi:hypothetical protein